MADRITKNSKIFVAGHNGLVGSALLRRLKFFGYKKILTISKKKLDFRVRKIKNSIRKFKGTKIYNEKNRYIGILPGKRLLSLNYDIKKILD